MDELLAQEQREADISREHSRECMADYGVPFDPYAEEGEE